MAVRKRNGHWHFDIQVRGVRHRGAIPEARNKAQAERAEAQIITDIFERKFGDGDNKNLAKFVRDTYEPAAKTRRAYASESFFIREVVAYFGRYNLRDISPRMIEEFKRERLAVPVKVSGKPRKASSVNREIGCLSRIFTMAKDNGLVTANPCSKVKRLRENNSRVRYLTKEEEEVLMATISGSFERLRPMIVLALNTGMRQGEIVKLKWAQVDWLRDAITVVDSKNGEDRIIPMNETVKGMLLRMWLERTNDRVFSGAAKDISRSFTRLVEKAGIEDFHFHDTRHSFATRLAPHTDAFTLAALLGHKSLAMVSRYTHPTDAGKRKAVEVLGQDSVTIEFSGQKAKAG